MDHSQKLIYEMNRYYDERAQWHDYYMGFTSIEGMEKLLKPIIEEVAKIVTGKHVLEIACGTGNWTQALARRAASVTATDVSLAALKIARKKLLSYTNISLIQSDAYNLNEIESRFDVLFASDWWSHIPKGALPSFLQTILGKL
jgi:ubiquinone/menaquinone biosynthesis C-methylase UbiE